MSWSRYRYSLARSLLALGLLRNRGSLFWDWLILNNLIFILIQVSEDIVEDEVTIWLSGKDEGLDEFVVWLVLVGHLTNHLDDDVVV